MRKREKTETLETNCHTCISGMNTKKFCDKEKVQFGQM